MPSGVFIFSDLHGQQEAACAIAEALARRAPARVLFAGDAYHPGRSPAAAILLARLEASGNFTAVAGNCDRDPAEDCLKYTMLHDYALVNTGAHRLFVTHGDRWNPRRLPPAGLGDILVYGHTHLPEARRLAEGGMLVFNPGSCALPRGGYPPSYGWFDGETLTVHNLLSDDIICDCTLT